MSVIAIIGMIFSVLQYIPQFLSVVKAIVDFIRSLHQTNPQAAHGLLYRLRDALVAARSGDSKPLEALAAEVKNLNA